MPEGKYAWLEYGDKIIIRYYIEVLKPRATILLTFIGVCAAIIASDGNPSPGRLLFAAVTILLASAGANGITNYLDCGIDARMRRTRQRALPTGRIYPPEKVLPLTVGLIVIGLVLSWLLHPLSFIADVVGTLVAVVWRKRAMCVFPQGMIASCAPVLMGWFAFAPYFSWEVVLLCVLIGVWLPVHVWSVMIANREDYIAAGLRFFPMSWQPKDAAKVLVLFSLILYSASLVLYFIGDFGWLYLALANIMGVIMVYASIRLVVSGVSQNAWRLYKLSSFPYLGIVFLVMCFDIWLSG